MVVMNQQINNTQTPVATATSLLNNNQRLSKPVNLPIEDKASANQDFSTPKRLAESQKVTLKDQANPSEANASQNQEAEKTTETIQHKNLIEKFRKDPKFRNGSLSIFNAILHGLTVLSSLSPQSNKLMKTINKACNALAFSFTKYIVPFISYGFATVQSFKNKRMIEGLIKLIPPLLLPAVGNANIDAVFGANTALNSAYDIATKRFEDRAKDSPEFAEKLKEAEKTFGGYNKLIIKEMKDICADFFKGKLNKADTGTLIADILILCGAGPMIAFARKARDTVSARVLGLLRNIGGIIGDISYLIDPDKRRKLIGALCGGAAITHIAKRWVGEKWSNILIHLGSALDVSGYAVWNARSGSMQKA